MQSAYFAGTDGNREQRDARNNEKLLASLGEQRSAYYACVMVFLRHAGDPRPLVAEGQLSLAGETVIADLKASDSARNYRIG